MRNRALSGILGTVLFVCSLPFGYAQDIIIKKNKEEIKSKVLEIGINEIKYKNYHHLQGPIIVIRKDDVVKIKYEDGTETVFLSDKYRVNHESEILNKTKILKVELFAPLGDDLTFGYEQMVRVGINMEVKLGIIGAGLKENGSAPQPGPLNRAKGAFLKAGSKFLIGQEFVVDGMRYAHPLKGKYIKAELIFTSFIDKNRRIYSVSSGTFTTVDVSCTSFAFNMILGNQTILSKRISFDYYAGLGYGVANQKPSKKAVLIGNDAFIFDPNFHSHLFFGKSFPMIVTGGLTMGYIF